MNPGFELSIINWCDESIKISALYLTKEIIQGIASGGLDE